MRSWMREKRDDRAELELTLLAEDYSELWEMFTKLADAVGPALVSDLRAAVALLAD